MAESPELIANRLLQQLEKQGLETWSYMTYENMLGCVNLVESVSNVDNIIPKVKEEIILHLFGVHKAIQNSIKDLGNRFKEITRQTIEVHLEELEAREQQKKEEQEKRIRKLLQNRSSE
jgi:hypothetical protein